MTSKQILGFLLLNTTISIIISTFCYLTADVFYEKDWKDFVVGFFGSMGIIAAIEIIIGLLILSIYLINPGAFVN